MKEKIKKILKYIIDLLWNIVDILDIIFKLFFRLLVALIIIKFIFILLNKKMEKPNLL